MAVNWPGLLQWSLKYSDGTSERSAMSEEDKEFLSAAIKQALSMMPDPAAVVKDAAAKLKPDIPSEEKITAWSVIDGCLESNPEMYRYLDKYDLVDPLLENIADENDDVSIIAMRVISNAISNNPRMQDILAEKNALQKIVNVWKNAKTNEKKTQALSAINSLIRHHTTLENQFVSCGGLTVIADAFNSTSYRYQEKGMSLLRHFFFADKISFEDVEKFELHDLIINLLNIRDKLEGLQHSELSAQLTVEFLQKHRPCLSRTGKLQRIRECLERRIEYIQLLQNEEEEKDFYKDLLEALHYAYKISDYPLSRTSSQKASSANSSSSSSSSATPPSPTFSSPSSVHVAPSSINQSFSPEDTNSPPLLCLGYTATPPPNNDSSTGGKKTE